MIIAPESCYRGNSISSPLHGFNPALLNQAVSSAANWLWRTDAQLRMIDVVPLSTQEDITVPTFSGRLLPEILTRTRVGGIAYCFHDKILEEGAAFRDAPVALWDKQEERWHRYLLSGTGSFDATGRFTGYCGVGVADPGRNSYGVMETFPEATLPELCYSVMKAAQEALLVLSLSGDVLYANPACERLFHDPRVGWVLPVSWYNALEHTILPALHKADDWEGISKIEDGNGRIFPLWQRGSVFRDQTGHARFVFLFMHDHTEQQNTENHLLDAKAAAEAESLAKTRLLKEASHDLRQPTHALGLYISALASRSLKDDQANVVERLQNSIDSLHDLMDSLFGSDISSSHHNPVTLELFQADTLMNQLKDECSPLCLAAGLSLRVVPSSSMIQSNKGILGRILRNLLNNAIRYTLTGDILFGCRKSEGRLRFEIWDTGIGIPESEQQYIFRELYRASGSECKEGSGMGLAIVERLSKILNHPITVRSKEGRGSVFAVEVPRSHSARKGK